MENPSTVFKPVLLPDVDNHRSRLPSASVRPIAQASKIVPPRSRLPTLRNNSTTDSNLILDSRVVVTFNNQENVPPSKDFPVTFSGGKRKSTSEADEDIPASKRVKPGNPIVKALATNTRRAARKSVNNALRISRKAAAGKPQNPVSTSGPRALPGKNIQKTGSCAARTAQPKVRKPLSQVTSKVNTGRHNSSVKLAQNTSSNNSSSADSSRNSGGSAPQTKKTKRKPWDLRGQVEDLKDALAEEKKKADVVDDILMRLKALEGEKNKISGRNSALTHDLNRQQSNVNQLQQEVSEKETIIQRKDEVIRDLEKRRHDQEIENRSLRKTIDDQDIELRQLRREKSAAAEDAADKEVLIAQLKAKLQQLETELRNKNRELSRMEEELNEKEVERKQLLNDVQELKGNIRVFCRVRPMLENELEEFGDADHIDYSGKPGKSIGIKNDSDKRLPFTFDRVFSAGSTQESIFEDVAQLVQSALDGYNVCIFAYGQTGGGKTYTMEGPKNSDPGQDGLIPRSMKFIMQRCDELKKFGWNYKLKVQQVEIYRENLHDLLEEKKNPNLKLEIKTVSENKRSRVWVKNLSTHPVSTFNEIRRLLNISKSKRATATTNANERSSRSHSVFILKIEATNDTTGEEIESSLNLIDLAGSERLSESGSSGARLKEAQKINSSLSELSNVISALANKDNHVPYRNSRLTFLLMDSLGGNSKTLMIVNVNPTKKAVGETINTLRFATTVNKCNIGTAQKVIKF